MKRPLVIAGSLTFTVLLVWAIHLAVGDGTLVGESPLAHEAPRLIAHAGGIIREMTYTNSREALEESYRKGYRYFEIDLCFTRDRHLVLIHDWGQTYRKYFEGDPDIPTLDEFAALTMKHGLHQMTAKDLFRWLEEHPDAHIVTDVKSDNLIALRSLATDFARCRSRIVPQIYSADEFETVRDMGYERIILTLYRTAASNESILSLAEEKDVFAFTMFPTRGARGDLSRRLRALGQVVYFHTVNSRDKAESLRELGAHGFYSDSLEP